LTNARDNGYRLRKIRAFLLPGTTPPLALGDKAVEQVSLNDVESYRDHRKAQGLSPVTINHDLKLMRKIYNWAIRKGLASRTPFKVGSEPALQLERETPRRRRFENEEDEARLLAAANPT